MNFAALRTAAWIALLCLAPCSKVFGQAGQVDLEDFKRLTGEVADLRDANLAQQRRMSQMQKEIDALREALRESNERGTAKMGEFTTRDDLKKMADKIQEVDQRREADRKLILEQFEQLGKTLAQPAEKPERPNRRRDKETKEPKERGNPTNEAGTTQPIEGTFYPYKVQDGQRLRDIVIAFNAKLKEEGRPPITMSQVKKANPKMNPDRILVGQEILLPVPDKKK
jgi:biotin carboxyl carrier protein